MFPILLFHSIPTYRLFILHFNIDSLDFWFDQMNQGMLREIQKSRQSGKGGAGGGRIVASAAAATIIATVMCIYVASRSLQFYSCGPH